MKYYLVGIKGSGMSSLAQCLKGCGEFVVGSDSEEWFFTEEKLKENKIPTFKFDKNNIEKYKNYYFIISYAYNENNNEEVYNIFNKECNYSYYSDFINEYFKNIKIGVAGTHGKTTISTMIKTLFENDSLSYIIGDGNGYGEKNSKYLILEACEYKYHFINYDYNFLVINNIDYDHPDFYNNINEVISAFKNVSKKTKCLIVNNDDIHARKIKHYCRYTYGIKNKSFVNGTILTENKNGYVLKVNVKNEEYIFYLKIYGIHMIYNFLAAFTIFYLTHNKNNIETIINDLMKNYQTPNRRNEEIVLKNGNIIIDDYAHHPNEIESTYQSIKQKYNDYNITIVFQPHTYSRTIYLYKEFKEVFSDKKIYIMNTFTSREQYDPIKEKIINDIFNDYKKYNINDIKKQLEKKKQIVIFMGAGNINNQIKLLKNEKK